MSVVSYCDPQNILAIVPNWLGDIVMATPALRALRRSYPDGKLAIAGRPVASALLEDIPWIDERLTIPSKGATQWFVAAAGLRATRWDLAVVFPHSFRAAALARIAGARQRIGYARDRRSMLLTHALPPHRENGHIQPVYMAQEYLDLLGPLGCEEDDEGLELAVDDEAVTAVKQQLEDGRPRVGIAPGAAFGSSKRWPAERYARVADELRARTGAQCVLLTGPGEEDTRDAVQQAAAAPLTVCDGGRPTIRTLKATVSQLDLLVCNDSGPRHVAVAFGVPTVCIMGPTSPAYSCGPYERGEVLRVDVDCGPCQKPICTTDHRCMTRIDVDWVVENALAHLESARPDGA